MLFKLKLYKTLRFTSPIGYVLGTTAAAGETFKMPAASKLTPLLPYWAVSQSFLELIFLTLNMLDKQKIHHKVDNSVGERLESLLLDSASIYAAYQLFAKSRAALAGGPIMLVYHGLAIQEGIRFCKALYGYLRAEMKINHNCSLYNVSREELKNNDPKLFAARNLALESLLSSATMGLGWMCLAMGHPAAVVLLGAMTLYKLRLIQREYAPNLFGLFHNDTKANQPRPSAGRPAMGFSNK